MATRTRRRPSSRPPARAVHKVGFWEAISQLIVQLILLRRARGPKQSTYVVTTGKGTYQAQASSPEAAAVGTVSSERNQTSSTQSTRPTGARPKMTTTTNDTSSTPSRPTTRRTFRQRQAPGASSNGGNQSSGGTGKAAGVTFETLPQLAAWLSAASGQIEEAVAELEALLSITRTVTDRLDGWRADETLMAQLSEVETATPAVAVFSELTSAVEAAAGTAATHMAQMSEAPTRGAEGDVQRFTE